jgi:hypothetical protein
MDKILGSDFATVYFPSVDGTQDSTGLEIAKTVKTLLPTNKQPCLGAVHICTVLLP